MERGRVCDGSRWGVPQEVLVCNGSRWSVPVSTMRAGEVCHGTSLGI